MQTALVHRTRKGLLKHNACFCINKDANDQTSQIVGGKIIIAIVLLNKISANGELLTFLKEAHPTLLSLQMVTLQ